VPPLDVLGQLSGRQVLVGAVGTHEHFVSAQSVFSGLVASQAGGIRSLERALIAIQHVVGVFPGTGHHVGIVG